MSQLPTACWLGGWEGATGGSLVSKWLFPPLLASPNWLPFGRPFGGYACPPMILQVHEEAVVEFGRKGRGAVIVEVGVEGPTPHTTCLGRCVG